MSKRLLSLIRDRGVIQDKLANYLVPIDYLDTVASVAETRLHKLGLPYTHWDSVRARGDYVDLMTWPIVVQIRRMHGEWAFIHCIRSPYSFRRPIMICITRTQEIAYLASLRSLYEIIGDSHEKD